MIVSVVLGGVVGLFIYLYNTLILNPKRLQLRLGKQGIRGPSPSFLVGNIPQIKRIQTQKAHSTTPKHVPIAHDWYCTLFAYIEQWRNQYGAMFTYSSGNTQLLCITDPEMVKQISLCTSLKLGKPAYMLKERKPMFGEGIISSSGHIWAYQKKVIAPELYLDKVKGMVDLMVVSTSSMLRSWESRIDKEGGIAEIKVDEYLRNSTADVISRACFGSSYDQGKDIFLKLRTLQQVMSKAFLYFGVPGFRHLPTKTNRETWRLEKEIDSMILRIVKQRIRAAEEKDLMQMILKGAKTGDGEYDGASLGISPEKFMVDNCKNIYFAGHETTATTAAWALMLLATHPEWQTRARNEVLEICKDGALPDADMLRSMKTLTMVIQETLRLYPVAAFLARQGSEDMQFKDIIVPKNVVIWIPVPFLHQNPDVWGPDAHLFNPERFANGILGACKIPQAYMHFGMGIRTCVGQQFAMVELKVILSLILSKFSFTLSPAYRHSPAFKLTIEPQHGVNLIVRKL
ncbi:cytochrome P450 714C2-like [Vitis riparia]|uniref:cytochrome P450 714C2-like n=1 Tax=Vitis riparia TaxID=96939 RepID=UPI00155ACC9B|nr:cytochrome P450 714C2-like [Vitis riparia]